MILDKTARRFAHLVKERFSLDIYTTEDSIRYLFFCSLLVELNINPNELVLEYPHPGIQKKKIDTISLAANDRPELVFEFKFDRSIPSGQNSPKPMKAGGLLKDVSRLAKYKTEKNASRCFFVYVTDLEMMRYMNNPGNNLAEFFNLGIKIEMHIDEEYINQHSKTLIESVGTITPCRISGCFREDYRKYAIRIYEIHV